jgi:hypothetical protein
MAQVVNLRLARKQRERASKVVKAEANHAVHGESKAAKASRRAEAERSSRHLDGSKLERD